MGQRSRRVIIIAAATLLSACTVQRTPAPVLQGPSELALSMSILANPDVLSQDGASQSQIVVQTRNTSGQGAPNIPFRAEITVGGVAADYGSLSARTLVTGNDGRATLTYTAPPPPLVSVDNFVVVTILLTPSGTDYSDALSRSVNIRLVPPGVIVPGTPTPTASFTFTPATPAALTNVVFDASTSTGYISSFAWDFGDGSTGTGLTVTHQFARPNSYAVKLTVTDVNSQQTSKTQTVTVGLGSQPTADFVFSPTTPALNQDIFFNAGLSKAGTGRTLVRYDWNFGSGVPQTGLLVTKAYDVAGTYTVLLTVTDDAGQTATKSQSVVVSAGPGAQLPVALFTFSPTAPSVGTDVFFNGTASTTPAGTITSYAWNFGDGNTASGSTTDHPFAAAGSYIVRLTVTNSTGQTGTSTQTVTVSAAVPGGLTAEFTYSPTDPKTTDQVFFNANKSLAGPGTTIVAYDWDFGDGHTAVGLAIPTTSHTYGGIAHGYNVILTIHDNLGRTATVKDTVTTQ